LLNKYKLRAKFVCFECLLDRKDEPGLKYPKLLDPQFEPAINGLVDRINQDISSFQEINKLSEK
jgi:hypothetical protein